MNFVVTVIISLFVLYQLSLITIKMILIIVYYQQFSAELYHHRQNLIFFNSFISCVNFSCNPYILFFSQFIQSFTFNHLTLYTSLYIKHILFKAMYHMICNYNSRSVANESRHFENKLSKQTRFDKNCFLIFFFKSQIIYKCNMIHTIINTFCTNKK